MPLDDEMEKGPAGVNGETLKAAKHGRQEQVMPDARRAEPVLRSFIAAGYELVPLNVASARDKKGRSIGKAPMFKNWRTAPALTLDQAVDHMERFGNIGVRLRETDLVVDVDPRNFLPGDDPLARLEKDTGVALREVCPTVVTGSGGLHLYLRKPADVQVRDSLEEYQGVEFKVFGRQVVAPSSIHPEAKKAYVLTMADVLSLPVPIDRAPEASAGLLGMIRRLDIYQGDQEAGDVEPEALALMLEVLDPTEFKDHTRWLELMMACHHATAGDGRTEFLQWTTSDPEYAEQTWSIGRRWDSLKPDSNGKRVTKKTLFMHVKAAGKKAGESYDHLLPVWERDPVEAMADFADVIGDADTGDLPVLEKAPPPLPPLGHKGNPFKAATPTYLADRLIGGRNVMRFHGEWLRYKAGINSYVTISDEQFDAPVWTRLDGSHYRTTKMVKGEEIVEVKPLVINGRLASDVVRAARAKRQVLEPFLPAWFGRRPGDPDVSELLAVKNGLLHLATGELLPPTPRFVTRCASPVTYDASAPEPKLWLNFLAEVFPDDPASRETLQEWVGYLISHDTSQQAMFGLFGRSRSGKGTIARILQELVGPGNCAAPQTQAFPSRFGLENLLGRQIAIFSDMRLNDMADQSTLIERLLRISGEDSIEVERKNKVDWNGKLDARFFFLGNAIPAFKDPTGALLNRLHLLWCGETFAGREDPDLTGKLKGELSGILNWAIEGLHRLRERGRFVKLRNAAFDKAQGLMSPVLKFAEEGLDDRDQSSVLRKPEAYKAFELWAEGQDIRVPDYDQFFKDLASSGLKYQDKKKTLEDGKRENVLVGLALKPEAPF